MAQFIMLNMKQLVAARTVEFTVITLRLIVRKPVFMVFDQVRHKLACSAIEASWSLEILVIASIGIILSKKRTTEVLIRLRGCAG